MPNDQETEPMMLNLPDDPEMASQFEKMPRIENIERNNYIQDTANELQEALKVTIKVYESIGTNEKTVENLNEAAKQVAKDTMQQTEKINESFKFAIYGHKIWNDFKGKGSFNPKEDTVKKIASARQKADSSFADSLLNEDHRSKRQRIR